MTDMLPFDETVKNKFTANQGGALLCTAKKAAAARQLLSYSRTALQDPSPSTSTPRPPSSRRR